MRTTNKKISKIEPETTSSQQQIIITHKCKKRKQYLIILDEAFIRSTDGIEKNECINIIIIMIKQTTDGAN